MWSEMNLVYCSCMCSEKVFEYLYKDSKYKPGQQVQKYNRILIKGLTQQEDVIVKGISKLPTNRRISGKTFIKVREEIYNDVQLEYLPCVNLPIINNVLQVVLSFLKILLLPRNTKVILDVLNVSMGIGIRMACKFRKFPLVGIVTDLPEQ